MRTLFNIWVSATILLYYFGPIEWPGRSEPWVALFVGTCILTFNLGYISLSNPERLSYSDFGVVRVLKDRRIAIGVMLLYAFLSLLFMKMATGQNAFSALTSGFDFTTVNVDYQKFLEDGITLNRTGRLVLLTKAALFPIALVLICQYYKSSPSVLVLFFVPMALFSLARGTDKETFDLLLIFGVVSYYYGLSNRAKLGIVAGALLVLYLFVARKNGRFFGLMPDCLPNSETCFDFDSALAQVSPLLEIGYVMVAHYITQGYEGLNIAFGLDFKFHFGLGHLPPVQSMVCGILGLSCNIETYNDRLFAYGWDTHTRWSSAYTMLADDFHWTFVPLYTFFIGRSLRLAEQDWRSRRNPTALAVIVLIGVFTFYSSANMQLGISLDWALATLFLLYGKSVTARTRIEG